MALERFSPPDGIDPGIADSPKQQQRSLQLGKQLIERLAAGNIEHGAKDAKRPWIEGGLADRLHQLVIDVGFIDVHLPQVRRIVAGRRRFSNSKRCTTGLFKMAVPMLLRAMAPQPFRGAFSSLNGPAAFSSTTPAQSCPRAAPAARAE